jgi:hypothetical protein
MKRALMNGMKPIKILAFFLAMTSAILAEDLFHANIYPDGEPDRLAYTHSNVITHSGDSTIIDHYYYTPDGKPYVLDKVILINDLPVFNSLKFYQIGEYSSFTRKGDQAELFYERDGKQKLVYRDMRDPIVFAPTQQNAIKENLPKLLKGESVIFNIFASEVLRLVQMKVQMLDHSQYDRDGCVVLIMRPKSIFIDWFVDEVYYVVEIKTGRLLEMHGFSTLRQKVDDKWEFRDMDFYYTYE